MTLLYPWWLVAAALCLALYWFSRRRTADGWRRVIDAKVLNYLRPIAPPASRQLYWLIAAIIALALSSPSVRTADNRVFKHAQGWLILVDVSRSMTLEDISPNRLSAARDVAMQIARAAGARSTTLIAYAGDAFIISPPSFDRELFDSSANLLEYGMVPNEGSNLSRALSLAKNVIDSSSMLYARVFIVGDSGGINSRAETAITQMADNNHRIDVILTGRDNPDNASPIDTGVVEKFADNGGGRLVRVDPLGRLDLNELALEEKTRQRDWLVGTGINSISWSNQSHWILLCALPLWLYAFWRERK
jgi:Ca-activated chloride channel family protein